MSSRFLHLLLAFLLLCAQAFAAAHAVEHTLEEGKGLPTHVCEICLAGHDLGSAAASNSAVPVVVAAAYSLPIYTCADRAALPAPQARQQSPPHA